MEDGLAMVWATLLWGWSRWLSGRLWCHSKVGLETSEGCRCGSLQVTCSITRQKQRGPFLGAHMEEASLPKASPTVKVPYLSHCAGQGVGKSLGLPGAPSAQGREQD